MLKAMLILLIWMSMVLLPRQDIYHLLHYSWYIARWISTQELLPFQDEMMDDRDLVNGSSEGQEDPLLPDSSHVEGHAHATHLDECGSTPRQDNHLGMPQA
ncbi:hypothetical protein ACQJBY_035584 [Aegilops geniculata]